MFGTNEVTGRRYFRDAAEAQEGKLLVTSMFLTIQGEGPLQGRPSFFVRLAKCQLQCHFCDTYFQDGDWFSPQEVQSEINRRIDSYFERSGGTPTWATHRGQDQPRRMPLVVTGGEPTLQFNLYSLLSRMSSEFESMQIETNGLIPPDVPNGTVVVCSPKCAEREGKATVYLRPHRDTLVTTDCLKFVLRAPSHPDGLDPYTCVPQWAHEWSHSTGRPVYVSPMNVYEREPRSAKLLRAGARPSLDERSTVDEVVSFWTDGLIDRRAAQRNHEYVAAYALQHGFRFSMQQHLFAGLA